jgi:hypothetical protein
LIEASLIRAREIAAEARSLLVRGQDPLEMRNRDRQKARQQAILLQAEQRRVKVTLARVARDYHERVIEPNRTSKHAPRNPQSVFRWVPHMKRRSPTWTR